MPKRVTFYTICYGRIDHLRSQQRFLEQWLCQSEVEMRQVVAVDPNEISEAKTQALSFQEFVPTEFDLKLNKSKIQNTLLTKVDSDIVIPLDVDLLPGFSTDLIGELLQSPMSFLFTGYQLKTSVPVLEAVEQLDECDITTSSEDSSKCLQKQLMTKEYFGVCPIIQLSDMASIGGYDENFVGWGAEDQDLIDRILVLGKQFCRLPAYLWFHLHHSENGTAWRDGEATARNRDYYYSKRLNKKS